MTTSPATACSAPSSALPRAIASRAAWLLPSVIAIVAIVPAAWALYSQSFAIFGRDQGIFQYVAWALRNGDRAYRDIHEINGPLPHAWYMLMQVLGGEDEHVFRSIDTLILVAAYVGAGLTLPRWVGLGIGREPRARHSAGIYWALAAVAVLGAQYACYDWWHTTQREVFYSALIVTSLGLQSIGHTTPDRRHGTIAFFFAGLFTAVTWFGKPPCVIFALLQALVLWLDRGSIKLPFRRIILAASAGAVVVGIAMLAFVVAYADLERGIEILSKVPRLHHTIWNLSLAGSYRAYNNAPRLDWAMATFAGFVLAFRLLNMPRRALLAGVLPIGGFVVFAGQGKAFPYHLHMLTLGTSLMQLVILAAIGKAAAEMLDGDARPTDRSARAMSALAKLVPERWHSGVAMVAVAAALALGAKAAQDAWLSPGVQGHWASIGATAEKRASRDYFNHFPWGDFFANDLRDAAAYLALHTRPDERVQTYGFDPYLLFLARRKSASPVIYDFELNVDAALEGGRGARPSPELRAWLLAYRDEAEELVLRSVEASPPAAFALFDRAPFTHPEDAEVDFAVHCPKLEHWMSERYVRAAVFGTVRIWLRRDVMERDAFR
jgi:hypothetical protein